MRYLFILFSSCIAFSAGAQQPKKAPAKTPAKPGAAKPAAGAAALLKASISRGQIVYSNTCLPCHQADGSGIPNMNPPLSKTEYVLGNKTRLINIILQGLTDEITVKGVTYSNPMPPLNYLTDEEISDVLTFVRNNFGNKASGITKAEVAKARK